LQSDIAVGFDGLLHFYKRSGNDLVEFEEALEKHLGWATQKIYPYAVTGDAQLSGMLASENVLRGCTVTNAGFYGPQGRSIRLHPALADFFQKLQSFTFNGHRITNLEMETAGIYGLAQLLGHRAISLNAILANRATGQFSKTPKRTVEALIKYTLERLADSPS